LANNSKEDLAKRAEASFKKEERAKIMERMLQHAACFAVEPVRVRIIQHLKLISHFRRVQYV
jgi:hypothetical protein